MNSNNTNKVWLYFWPLNNYRLGLLLKFWSGNPADIFDAVATNHQVTYISRLNKVLTTVVHFAKQFRLRAQRKARQKTQYIRRKAHTIWWTQLLHSTKHRLHVRKLLRLHGKF